MPTLKVILENTDTGETLDLDEISQNGEGVQALAGITGFGLPPVEVQQLEGAGDGAQLRSVRVQPNDFDIPLYVEVEDRAALTATVAKISRVVTGPMELRLYVDDVHYRSIDVWRVAGGTYTYGLDSTGDRQWESILTVRAGSPFWRHVTDEAVTFAGDDFGFDMIAPSEEVSFDLDVDNPGTAPAKPVWELTGPFDYLRLESPSGESVEFASPVDAGETVTIDTATGTVTDGAGNNRYGDLAPTPRLWRVPGGVSAGLATIGRPPVAGVRTNFVPNPDNVGAAVDPWLHDGYSATVDAGRDTAPYNTVYTSGGRMVFSGNEPSSTVHSNVGAPVFTGTFDLTDAIGELVVLRGEIGCLDPDTNLPGWLAVGLGSAIPGPYASVPVSMSFGAVVPGASFTQPFETQFIVSSEWASPVATINIVCPLRSVRSNQYNFRRAYIKNLYIGQPGPNFSGSTVDTANFTYDWTGTANDSPSTATPVDGADPMPTVLLRYTAQDWMVV